MTAPCPGRVPSLPSTAPPAEVVRDHPWPGFALWRGRYWSIPKSPAPSRPPARSGVGPTPAPTAAGAGRATTTEVEGARRAVRASTRRDEGGAVVTEIVIEPDLSAMLAEPLPPCMACPEPTVRVVNAKCHLCNISIRVGFCARHLQLARLGVARGDYPSCSQCTTPGTIRFEGLS